MSAIDRLPFLCGAIFALATCHESLAGDPTDIGTRRELFVDSELIASISGDGGLQLHRPLAREVALTTDAPWEGNTSAYYAIFQDDEIYRMYYRGSHYDEATREPTHREVTCYAESHNGIDWQKPRLGLVEFNGSKENNIVWDGVGTHCFTPFKDTRPGCRPDARYKAISRGRPQAAKGLYAFQSPDGIHWSMMQQEPVITEGAFDSQNLAFWDPHLGKYREYHRIFVDGVRAIMTGTSDDFLHWTEPVLLDYGTAPAQQLYTNAVQSYARAPHILIGFPTRFLPDEGERVEPTLMASRDGIHFQRWLDPVIPETAPKDRSGNRSNYMTWGMLQLPDAPNELSVYASEAYYTGPDSRLRRFVYRVDGFVSLRGESNGATLVTKSIKTTGHHLSINFQTRPGGSVRVALIDPATKKPLDGFSFDECEPLEGDDTHRIVSWKGMELDRPNDPIEIHFHVKLGDLYSYRFE